MISDSRPAHLTHTFLPSTGRWTLWLSAAMAVVSIGATLAIVTLSFGTGAVAGALSDVHRTSIVCAVILGILIQILRAQRARSLLEQNREITLGHSYGAMVVSHGIGDLLPLAPAGPLLRSTLTQRFANIPIAFSSGVFVVEGMLDGIGPAIMAAYLFLALPLPVWVRGVCAVTMGQMALLLLVPVMARRIRGRGPAQPRSGRKGKLLDFGDQLAAGLAILTARPVVALTTVGFSLLISAVAVLQSALFFQAFELQSSIAHLCLFLTLSMAAGSLPVKIPGFGTAATTAFLPVAGIHGAGVAGFIVITRLISSAQSPLLGAAVLGWWMVRRRSLSPLRGEETMG